MKKFSVWMAAIALVAGVFAGCSKNDDNDGSGNPPEKAVSTLGDSVTMSSIEMAKLSYQASLSNDLQDVYYLTLSSRGFDSETLAGDGEGIRFEIVVPKEGTPFGSYTIGDGKACVPGTLTGDSRRLHSWYVKNQGGRNVSHAPLTSGTLSLTEMSGTESQSKVSFAAYDDHSPAYAVKGSFTGDLLRTGRESSTLTENVAMGKAESAKLSYQASLSDGKRDVYYLTLSGSGFDAEALTGTGEGVRFELAVAKGASPFGRYTIGGAGSCVPGTAGENDGKLHSWYMDGRNNTRAPLSAGVLDLTKVLGKKPSNTYYSVSFTAYDDHSPAYSIDGRFSGNLSIIGTGGGDLPATTYVYAGVSGYSQEDGYTTWGIDFDSKDFTKHLAVMSINTPANVAFEDGIPAGTYTISEDDAEGTATWVMYDDASTDASMVSVESGTIKVERSGSLYTVLISGTDENGENFSADFKGEFHYENVTGQSAVTPHEVYAVWYGPKEGTSMNNWYITLADNGYLTTADAAGNYYYGNIIRFDLVTDLATGFADGLPEGTFPVQASRSGAGIWGGDGADCTSFLTEYFSGGITICKLMGGHVTIVRSGENYTITFDGLTMSGDRTQLSGSYTGKVQYIDFKAENE